jgi:hypothetical protein
MARVIADQFPRAPQARQLAAALNADLTGPLYGDLHSSARYRFEVAPVVSRRAAQLMSNSAAPA